MAQQGFGITFQYTVDTGTSWVSIGEVTDATPPSISKDTIDTTHHQTPSGVRTFMGGLVDNGEATVEVNYDVNDTGHILLRTRAGEANDLPLLYRFIHSDTAGTIDEFSALITGFESESPMDDKVSATITLKISGVIDYDTTA